MVSKAHCCFAASSIAPSLNAVAVKLFILTAVFDIAAGTAVRFEPGQTRDVQLVALAGKRVVYGFRGDVMGKL